MMRSDVIGRVGGWAAGLVAASVLLTACLGTSYTYVSHPASSTYLKLPPSWRVYGVEDVVKSKALGLTPDQQVSFKKQIWQEAFDSDPQPSLDHVFQPGTDHPAGVVRVRTLTVADADAISVGSLRTEILPTDPLSTTTTSGNGFSEQVVSYSELSRPGGYRGSHLVVTVRFSSGELVTFDQMGFIDGKGHHTYVLALACPPACYRANKGAIDRIFTSWVLKGAT